MKLRTQIGQTTVMVQGIEVTTPEVNLEFEGGIIELKELYDTEKQLVCEMPQMLSELSEGFFKANKEQEERTQKKEEEEAEIKTTEEEIIKAFFLTSYDIKPEQEKARDMLVALLRDTFEYGLIPAPNDVTHYRSMDIIECMTKGIEAKKQEEKITEEVRKDAKAQARRTVNALIEAIEYNAKNESDPEDLGNESYYIAGLCDTLEKAYEEQLIRTHGQIEYRDLTDYEAIEAEEEEADEYEADDEYEAEEYEEYEYEEYEEDEEDENEYENSCNINPVTLEIMRRIQKERGCTQSINFDSYCGMLYSFLENLLCLTAPKCGDKTEKGQIDYIVNTFFRIASSLN